MWVVCTAREHTRSQTNTFANTDFADFTSTVCHRTQAWRPLESRLNLSLHFWNYQHGYLDHGLFTSQRMLIFRSNSYNWWIKHQELLFNNAVQALSLKEPFRMKTTLKYRQLRPLIFLSFSFLPPLPLFHLLASCRWVLAECEGFGRHSGSFLPAGAETAAETRFGQRGRHRHRLAVDGSYRFWQVGTKSCLMSSASATWKYGTFS